MELSDSFQVMAPSSRVWEFFWDFTRLASCLPGCDRIEAINESSFSAYVKQRIGPFSLGMELVFTVQEVTPNRSVILVGGDRRGRIVKVNRASLDVTSISPEESRVSYNADVHLLGKLGILGYSVVNRKAKEVGAEFSRRLAKALETPSDASSSDV